MIEMSMFSMSYGSYCGASCDFWAAEFKTTEQKLVLCTNGSESASLVCHNIYR